MNRRDFTKTAMVSTVGRTLASRFLFRGAMAAAGTLGSDSVTLAQQAEGGLLKIGGFRCVNLVPFKNDMLYDLYTIGYWSYGAFRMDIWRRHGVPFWYPRGSGNLRVAGRDWRPHPLASISSNLAGSVAKADAQGTEGFAIDRDPSTSWYAGDNRPDGKLWVEFPSVTRVKSIRFLGGDSPQNAAKDYTVGLILPSGSWRQIASIRDEKRIGQWIEFGFREQEAKGVYLDVARTVEGIHGPRVCELQAVGDVSDYKSPFSPQITIPLRNISAEEICFLGHVGEGFETLPGIETSVGEYVLMYENGQEEIIPLIAGKNVARLQFGHFVPEAEFAFGLRGLPHQPGELFYHLDEMLPVEPKRQIMSFTHALSHPDWSLKALRFRCTHPEAMLVLAGVTLRQSGPRMNALFYNGRTLPAYPKDAPEVAPSPIQAMLDKAREVSLDGPWQYALDPGNLGVQKKFYDLEYHAASWKSMLVPSQWYVQGIDYHGVVWFRREFEVPDSFPGPVAELSFGAVDYDARVWINGQYVGRHIGAFAAFKFDASQATKRGEKNLIVVRVDSPLDPGFAAQKTLIKGNSMDDISMPYGEEGCMGGISRSVVLRGRGQVGIENAWTTSKVSEDLQIAKVLVKFELSWSKNVGQAINVSCRLSEPRTGQGEPRTFVLERSVSLLTSPTSVELSFEIENPKLWYPWEQGAPHLHILEIEAWAGTVLLDKHIARVGIREIGFTDHHCLLVNHHRIFLKGMLNDGNHWESLMDRKGYHRKVQLQREANLNVIRMIGHQSSPDMYDLCDEMGIMIWQEMPLQWGYSTTEPIRRDILQVVRETVLQCRSHASVIGWSAWNEGGQAEFSTQITSLIASLDLTRPMTRASGREDFDTHIYPNLMSNLYRRTPLWTGIEVAFVSETGSYGMASLDEIKEVIGPDLFPFDSAEYFWDTFNSYRYNDGTVFLDAPRAADWPKAKIRAYVMSKVEASQRWFYRFQKFQYEYFRGMRFAPTNAMIYCRFDEAFPSGFYGSVVTFDLKPRPAYFAVQQACQQVLPIMFFGFTGVDDIRVVNEYWHHSWQACSLRYILTTRDGKILRKEERRFDLPPDSTVKVFSGDEAGDVWHVPGGFRAELEVVASDGSVLSKNDYDFSEREVGEFIYSLYPPPPVEPVDAILLRANEITVVSGGFRRFEGKGTYSRSILEMADGNRGAELSFEASVPRAGDYYVRVATDSGKVVQVSPGGLRQDRPSQSFELMVDGQNAERETYPSFKSSPADASEVSHYTVLPLTRRLYSQHKLAWYPGWQVRLTQGRHRFILRWPKNLSAPSMTLDAIALQYRRIQIEPPAHTHTDNTLISHYALPEGAH